MWNNRTLAALFSLGCSMIGKIVSETCYAITTNLQPQYVVIPQGEKLKEIVDEFITYWGSRGYGWLSYTNICPNECIQLFESKRVLLYHHASHG